MRTRLLLACLASVACLASGAGRAVASPTIPLDDPVYERLAILRAEGRLPLYLGGIRPLTEYDAQRLLLQANDAPDATLPPVTLHGLWFNPARRAIARVALFADEQRPYSTPERPTGMLGGLEVSCEHQEGRPCGPGGGVLFELDSAAGFGHWVSAFTRLQFMAGANQWEIRGAIDRGYLNGQVGPVALLVGRDVLALGPGVHTQLMWGDHGPAFDQVRLQTAHPIKIPRIPVTVSALYAVGRLRDPQTFHNTVATVARLGFAFADQFEIAAMQILQLDGDGAVQYDFAHFVAEHFTRTGNAKDAGASNRRDSFDVAYTNRWARGLRIYYELAFEDFRRYVVDMFLYDCDHLLGFEMPALTAGGKHGFVVELQHNGLYSQSHTYFTSGLTSGGRVVGAPLGPDSWSLYLRARVDLRHFTLWPWAEWARLSSDQYQAIEFGPINLISRGQAENRVRLGADARLPLRRNLRLEARALYEHVEGFAFAAGQRRDNGGVEIVLDWSPQPR